MAYCRKCGTELNDGVKFCPKCGEKVEENLKQHCLQCGFERQGTEIFCPKCGTPFESSEIVQEKKSSIMRYAIVGILCLLVLLACYYIININDTKPASNASMEVVDTANDDNISDSYDNTTSQNIEEEIDTDDDDNKVDVSAIIDECQEEVSSIQEEMESLCTNFLISASDNDLDMLSFGRMKSNFTMAYSDLEKKANDAFDRCIKELNRVGDTSSANQMKEEKQEFNSASLKQRYETQASAEMVD